MAARKQRRNWARAERRRRARSHLMAAAKVIEAQRKVQRGTSTPTKKANARPRFSKSVQRAKTETKKAPGSESAHMVGAAATMQKWEDPETPAAQPVNVQSGEINERPVDGRFSVQDAPTQPWVAVGSSTTDCAPKVGRTEDDGVLFKIKIQIQGRTYVALVDSGASRNYAAPEAVVAWELQGTPDVVHLELVDGSKIRST